MENYKNISQCRICGSKFLTEVINIGPQYISPVFVKSNKDNELSKIKIPLTLVLCDKNKNQGGCGLLQLKETVNPELLYRNYFYRSAVSSTMRKDLFEVVEDVKKHIKLEKGDYVVDVGANDCTMINYFPKNLNRIAVEPAKNINWSEVDSSIKIVNDYFSAESLKNILKKKAKVITACAMFYDLDNPNEFVADIKSTLAKDGLCCMQLTYLPSILRNASYDMCNEHLEYYSLRVLNYLMEKNGLSIFDASINDVNGGSIRVFICHKENSKNKSENFKKIMEEEDRMKLDDLKTYKIFYQKLLDIKAKVNNFIKKETSQGKLIIGLGASTKGNGIMQMFGISKKVLPYISERNPEKFGLKTLGTDMEIISEERARSLRPYCMVVLPWHFKKEIVEREKDYIKSGGKLLFLMPYCHIVDKNGETNL